jgi:hypothetical protein
MSTKRGEGVTAAWLHSHASYDGSDCLIWPFARTTAGYGCFGHEGEHYRAHRYMCRLVNGPPPTPKHEAAHSCGRGHDACVHPKHLSWKTRKENQDDRIAHGTVPKRPRRVMLTPEQVIEIRAAQGRETTASLMARFNTSHSNILDIQRGVTWKGGIAGKGGFAVKPYRGGRPKVCSLPKAE